MNYALQIRDVSLSFGGVKALNGVTINFPRSKIIGIIGPNGAGKTSVLNVASGVSSPDSGEIFLDGISAGRLPAHEIARLGLRRTFQSSQLFPGMTVMENMMAGVHLSEKSGVMSCAFRTPRMRREEAETRDRAMEALKFVGFESFASRHGSALSFGQQRIIEIARTLICDPKIVLLDEPAVGLSVNRVAELDELLRKIRDDRGVTIIMIEHVIRLVMGVSDHIVVMNSGRKIAEGTADEIRDNPDVVTAYLGTQVGSH